MARPILYCALALACACATPAPPPAASAPPSPTAVVILRADVGAPTPAPAAASSAQSSEPAPVDGTVAETAPPPGESPPDLAARPDQMAALAAAPAQVDAPASASGPTPAVLPPSARLVRGLTPTPDVVASSPALAPETAAGPGADYARAIKLVQDSRKAPATQTLQARIDATIARAREKGSEVEVLGWQASLKGSTDLYQVTFTARENRQGVRAEWEANVATGEVRAVNPVAQALESS